MQNFLIINFGFGKSIREFRKPGNNSVLMQRSGTCRNV